MKNDKRTIAHRLQKLEEKTEQQPVSALRIIWVDAEKEGPPPDGEYLIRWPDDDEPTTEGGNHDA